MNKQEKYYFVQPGLAFSGLSKIAEAIAVKAKAEYGYHVMSESAVRKAADELHRCANTMHAENPKCRMPMVYFNDNGLCAYLHVDGYSMCCEEVAGFDD